MCPCHPFARCPALSSHTGAGAHASAHTPDPACTHLRLFSAKLLPRFLCAGACSVRGKWPRCVPPDHTQAHSPALPSVSHVFTLRNCGCIPRSCSEQLSEDGASICLQQPSRLDPPEMGPLCGWPGPETGHTPHPARGRWVSLQCQSQRGAQEAEKTRPPSVPECLIFCPFAKKQKQTEPWAESRVVSADAAPPAPRSLWLACLISGSGLFNNSGGARISIS